MTKNARTFRIAALAAVVFVAGLLLAATQTRTVDGKSLLSSSAHGTLADSSSKASTASAAVACSYSFLPTSGTTVSGRGGMLSIAVTATDGCTWSVSSDVSWLIVTSMDTKTGNGTATVEFNANNSGAVRTGTITIAGQNYDIQQANDAATPVADYRFNNSLASSAGSAPSLSNLTGPNGANSFADDVVDGYTRKTLRFPQNSGLSLDTTGLVTDSEWTIVMLAKFDAVSGYRRVADFSNGTQDCGAYILDGRIEGEALTTFPSIPVNTYLQITVTKEPNGRIRVYRDGILRLEIASGDPCSAIVGNTIRFFKDDTQQDGEATAGNIARLTVFNKVLDIGELTNLDRLADASGGGTQGMLLTTNREGYSDIYSMNSDGTNQRRLTTGGSGEVSPRWSPDGSKVVFLRQDRFSFPYRIWVMNADGTNQRALTGTDTVNLYPSWKPDGSKVVFSRCDSAGNACDTWTVNPDGSGAEAVSAVNTAADEFMPMYSPDGSKIAFTREVSAGLYALVVVNADGSGQTQVTSPTTGADMNARFSPNGQKLAFTRQPNPNNISTWDIYTVNVDGTGLTRMTNNSYYDNDVTWSPDGTMLAYSTRREYFNEIHVMDSTTGAPLRRLTFNNASDRISDWRGPASPSCSFTVSASSSSAPTAGGTVNISISTAAGCSWNATTSDSWITLPSVPYGSGSATITVTAASNSGGDRSGSVTIAGQTVTISQSAVQATCVSATMPTTSASSGAVIAIPVQVGDLTDRNVNAFDLDLRFDPSVLQPAANPVDSTGTMSSAFLFSPNTTTSGRIILSAYGTSALTGSGTLVNLVFTVVGAPQSSSALTLQQFQFNEGDPCATVTNGSVSVASGSVAGSVKYYFGTSPLAVPNVTLTATGNPQASATTNSNGAYQINLGGSGTYVVTASKTGGAGDAVSAADAAKVAQTVSQLITLSTNQRVAADATGNGTLTSLDAARIAQTAAGVPNNGLAGTWKFLPNSRTYSSVRTDLTGEDYVAILIGDVTGNWTTASPFAETLIAPFDAFGSFQATKVQASIPSIEARNGETVMLPLRVGDLDGRNVTAFDLVVDFNPNVLVPVIEAPADVNGTTAANFAVVSNPAEPGKIRIAAYGITPLTGGGPMIRLAFKVVGERGSFSDVVIEKLSLNEGETGTVVSNGRVTVRDIVNGRRR